jgi:hypothetical protein
MNSFKTLFVFFVLVVLAVQALDVSFIPNDENAPLPLSAKYRESLKKLCQLLNVKGAKLPVELEEKKDVLEKMCRKLAKDDANIGSAEGMERYVRWSAQSVALSLLGIGGGYLLWNNRQWIKKRVDQARGGNNRAAPGVEFVARNDAPVPVQQVDVQEAALIQQRIIEAREARLQRFAGLNAAANVQNQ